MHRLFRFSVLLGASLLFTGCSTADKRIDNIEAQMQNVQVLDIRLANAEERLTKVEGDIVSMKDVPAAKTKGGKKNAKAANDKAYALPPPAPTARTTAAAPQPVHVSPQPAPRPVTASAQPAPRPAPIPGVPQPYESVYTDGRRVEPRPTPAPASASPSGEKPAPAITPVSLATAPPAARPAPIKPAPAKTAAAPASPAVSKTGTSAYDAALALYYKGQYAKAQEGFTNFLSASPSSKLAPNAMYWQGECQYSQGRFDNAIMTFKDLAGKYPKHPKAAAALLKAGYAYAQLRDMENARFYWQILIDDFPKSEPANMARKRMAQG